MEKIQKSQIFKTAILFAFLLMIPFISSSLRTHYLYFILNLLILFLAIESGVLATTSDTIDEMKDALLHPYLTSPLLYNHSNFNSSTNATTVKTLNKCKSTLGEKPTANANRTMLGVAVVPVVEKTIMKKCSSRPSLFFIGGFEEEKEEIMVQEEVRPVEKKIDDFKKKNGGEDNEDDLFFRAEKFIGNFYKQLKIQREDSWKRLHGIGQKACSSSIFSI